jgi:hypothetical protein
MTGEALFKGLRTEADRGAGAETGAEELEQPPETTETC